MAKKENKYKGYGIATQAIHTGTDYDEGTGAVRRPLHMANSYKLPDDLSPSLYLLDMTRALSFRNRAMMSV